MATHDTSSEKSPWWLMAGVLAMVCFFVRILSLTALPIFSDEAIYLRWAQLIHSGHMWVSLVDPKPPLHFWLLALATSLIPKASDPLIAARMISVIAATLSIPALIALCEEIGKLSRHRPPLANGKVVGMLAAVLIIFCPYVAFYQRLATAESLFLLEMLVALWLSLRWGRKVMHGQKSWPLAIALGITLGLAMLTRQGFSYVLWAFPIIATALARNELHKKRIAPALLQFLTALLIAAILWTPYLTAQFNFRAADRGGPAAELRARILYQEQFTGSNESRATVISRNITSSFLPTSNPQEGPTGGWLPLYMTLPLYCISLLGFFDLALRRQWRILAFLLLWAAFILGPPIFLGTVLRSRYIVAGVPVLLISASYLIGEFLAVLMLLKGHPLFLWGTRILGGAALASLLILPMRNVGLQSTQWWNQPLTSADRYEYITGWTAGRATMDAVKFVKGYAAKLSHDPATARPLILITDNGWGLPSDGLWAYLANGRVPNLTVYYTSRANDGPLLIPASAAVGKLPESYMLRKNKWLYTPAEPITLPPNAAILYITGSQGGDDVAVTSQLEQLNPNLKPVISFYGIEGSPRDPSDDVLVFELQ